MAQIPLRSYVNITAYCRGSALLRILICCTARKYHCENNCEKCNFENWHNNQGGGYCWIAIKGHERHPILGLKFHHQSSLNLSNHLNDWMKPFKVANCKHSPPFGLQHRVTIQRLHIHRLRSGWMYQCNRNFQIRQFWLVTIESGTDAVLVFGAIFVSTIRCLGVAPHPNR